MRPTQQLLDPTNKVTHCLFQRVSSNRVRRPFFAWLALSLIAVIARADNLRPPSNLIATVISSTQINLRWTDNSTNELGTRIELAPSSAGPWRLVGFVGANVTTYSSTGLSPSTTYCYRVNAYDSGSVTAYSNLATATTLGGPVARCKNVVVSAGSDCLASASIDDGSFDPSGAAVTLTQSPAGPYPLGTTSVTLTVTSSQGAASCTASVTVLDQTPPDLLCPADLSVQADPGQCSAVVTFDVSATDNCSQATVTCQPPSGSSFPVGSSAVSCTASDSSQNAAHCSFNVDVVQPVSIRSSFNPTPIQTGTTIWFNSVLARKGPNSTNAVTFRFFGQQITSSNFMVNVPDAIITFDPAATTATTSFAGGQWVTRVPSSGVAGQTFLSGVGYMVPSNLPGGINPVTWSGTFLCDTPGVTLEWKWAAAVYTSFSADPSALGVKPVDDAKASAFKNADHAGTPENYKSDVIAGARGGGGSNYTGAYSGPAAVSPCGLVR